MMFFLGGKIFTNFLYIYNLNDFGDTLNFPLVAPSGQNVHLYETNINQQIVMRFIEHF